MLSGNHRTLAAIEAGLEQIWWMQIDQPLPRQRQIALQLFRNVIAGQDDPAILKELYEELESVEWRQCTGLDDKTLDLLEKVDLASLGEANFGYEPVLVALETSRVACKVGNSATTFGVILAVFERHLGELAAAPLETVFGVREVPVETAAAIRAAIDRLVCEGSVPENAPWRALEVLAAREPQYSSCRAWSSDVRRRDRAELTRRVGEP
ncbi:hypothetical protein AB0G77_18100 [Streptomyces hygroscopicus]|uniref:hypothetical protein n=1 Tax=Streptomyces hygroscopicus TaxID=1912 RepID=UPI003408B7C4